MLSPHARRILEAFVDAMIPAAADGLGPSGLEADVPDKVEDAIRAFPDAQRRLFPLALWAIELYPLFLGPRLRVFSQLDRRGRTRVLERLEHHFLYPLRSGYMALKLFCFMFWAEHPEVARATHWSERCR